MKLQLTVLGGTRSGTLGVFAGAEVTLGRHPGCDFVFDTEQDLGVSARHAVIVRQGTRWLVRDLGSRNGTRVNGHPIRGDTRLDQTDHVQLGADGPVLEVRFVPDSSPDVAPPRPAAATGALRPTGEARAPAPSPPRHGPSTTQRIRLEVGRQTRRLRALIALLVVILAAGGGYTLWDRRAREGERARERAALEARIDSILRASEAAVTQLRGEAQGLADALRASRREIGLLQERLRAAEAAGRSEEADSLRAQIVALSRAMTTQQAAASVDFQAIHEANHRAVAMIWTEFAPGDVETGTAFAVRPDGVLITARHVVLGPRGDRRPRRLAVQFTNSEQVWRASLLGASREADLAAIRVEGIRGTVPIVPLPDPPPPVRPGEPVATIGFPFGSALPMRAADEGNLVRASLTAGAVSKVTPAEIQIDGYGAQGASGSPVFDRDGRLVGVLSGGEAGSGGRIVYAVPVNPVTALLRSLGL
ncbi:MAG TPA: trypsin-like peptidase domain-containing protein [Gemmatimonadales bacterium]|nr:trypsin-like peptidase domain-containing protein [Gemmatimonadales bacterium]